MKTRVWHEACHFPWKLSTRFGLWWILVGNVLLNKSSVVSHVKVLCSQKLLHFLYKKHYATIYTPSQNSTQLSRKAHITISGQNILRIGSNKCFTTSFSHCCLNIFVKFPCKIGFSWRFHFKSHDFSRLTWPVQIMALTYTTLSVTPSLEMDCDNLYRGKKKRKKKERKKKRSYQKSHNTVTLHHSSRECRRAWEKKKERKKKKKKKEEHLEDKEVVGKKREKKKKINRNVDDEEEEMWLRVLM